MIGLTGGIASGKTTVSARLRELGAFVADADEVSREVIADPAVLSRIRGRFGPEVFREDGSLDRRALAAAAFSEEGGAAALNAITHPAIAARLLELASEAEREGFPLVFVDAALLIEAGFNEFCSSVWLVTANTESRLARIMERDGLTYAEASARIANQLSDETKRLYANVVIENDGTYGELIEKVDRAFFVELSRRELRENAEEYEEIKGVYEEEQG